MPKLHRNAHGVTDRPRPEVDDTPETKIGRKIEVQPNGCWIFNGNPHLYGSASPSRDFGTVRVHRFVYETLVGPIPEGHHLHHECDNVGCCNPEHLTPLTPKEHKARHPRHAA